MAETALTAERCLDLIRAAAPGLAATVTTDPWHGTHARAELEGATTVKFAYVYSGPEGRLDLHLYPADTLGQARALYSQPTRIASLRALRGVWELRPNFHFGFAAKGLTGTTSSIGAEAYIQYWMARIATLETFPRADWQRELEKLVADGIFSADDVPLFERDFTETGRDGATPRPGLCLSRSWELGAALADGFSDELGDALREALGALGEHRAEAALGGSPGGDVSGSTGQSGGDVKQLNPRFLPGAQQLLAGWVGRTISTVTGSPNVILGVSEDAVLVGTAKSPEGAPVPLRMVQSAMDQLARDGEVEISPDAVGHRSAFCGAVLLTLPGVVRRRGTPPRVGLREERQVAVATPADRGAIQPWWIEGSGEVFWMEITDRADIGTDLHCPQRDSVGKTSSGFSSILFVQDGDVVVHYDGNERAITSWSVARGDAASAPIHWASHRAATRRRLGSELREQPGWWLDLEGPFLVEPVSLAALRARGPEILAAIASVAPAGATRYAPFYGYGQTNELRPINYYLTKLPRAVAEMLPPLSVGHGSPPGSGTRTVGTAWRRPRVTETAESIRQTEIDIETVERGRRGHVDTEIAVADALRALGVEPLSPTLHDPNFDVAWEHEGTLYVAEIKSVTDENEERQLRLGLGQIIRFRSLLASRWDRQVRAVLVPERRPRDDAWRATCEGAGVELMAADEFARRLPSLLESAVA